MQQTTAPLLQLATGPLLQLATGPQLLLDHHHCRSSKDARMTRLCMWPVPLVTAADGALASMNSSYS
jgi:hypothetical protein